MPAAILDRCHTILTSLMSWGLHYNWGLTFRSSQNGLLLSLFRHSTPATHCQASDAHQGSLKVLSSICLSLLLAWHGAWYPWTSHISFCVPVLEKHFLRQLLSRSRELQSWASSQDWAPYVLGFFFFFAFGTLFLELWAKINPVPVKFLWLW